MVGSLVRYVNANMLIFFYNLKCFQRICNFFFKSQHIDLWVLYLWHVRPANADWVIAGPYFSSMILNKRMPCYFANGITYGTPWFAESVEKVCNLLL